MSVKKNEQAEVDTALKTLDLLQELVWAIRSRESIELSEGVSYLRNLAYSERGGRKKQEKKPEPRDRKEDLKSLVGSMSLVLADTELFPANEDIAKFGSEALRITIARWDKRSRYEMIGMLIMESMNASPQRLREVGNLLNKISEESETMANIKSRSRQVGFSWNETIRSLWTSVE